MRHAIFLIGSSLTIAASFAQSPSSDVGNFPTKSVRIIVPFPPGGGTEALARLTAEKLTERWGQQVVIDNRGGAGGTIGSYLAAKSAPDGYTLLIGLNGTHGMAQSLYRKIPYDTIRDFTPITMLAIGPNILTIHPSVPAQSVKELIALARTKPGQLNFGSPGTGTPPHLQLEVFNLMAGTKIAHVPYKGGGPANIALLSGEVQGAFTAVTVGLPFIQVGKLRGLALTGARRPASALLSGFPTIAENGLPDYDENTWYGLFAPAEFPTSLLAKINADVVKVLLAPDIREYFARQGQDIVGDTPEHFAATVRDEVAKWAKIIRQVGIQID